MIEQSHLQTIERLVDRYGLQYVIDLLAEVCYQKEEHLITQWQDHLSAVQWNEAATKLSSIEVDI